MTPGTLTIEVRDVTDPILIEHGYAHEVEFRTTTGPGSHNSHVVALTNADLDQLAIAATRRRGGYAVVVTHADAEACETARITDVDLSPEHPFGGNLDLHAAQEVFTAQVSR